MTEERRVELAIRALGLAVLCLFVLIVAATCALQDSQTRRLVHVEETVEAMATAQAR